MVPDDIKKAFAKSAKAHKVSIAELSRSQFRETFSGRFGYQIQKLGGHNKVKMEIISKSTKKDLKPELPPNPLATEEVQKLHGHELSKYIANIIEECATRLELAPHELTWYEFRRHINLRYGTNDRGVARYTITRAGGFNAIRDAYFAPSPTPNTVDRTRLREQANLNRKLGEQYSKQHFVLDRLQEFTKDFVRQVAGLASPPNHYAPKQTKIARTLTLVCSDWHIGSDLLKEETGYEFGTVEETRRVASIGKRVVEHDLQHRAETHLDVLLLGDLIQGLLHDARDGAVLAEQMMRCLYLVTQLITYLSAHFPSVKVRCTPGNHGRNKSRHKQRAIQQKWDSLENMIYYGAKLACSSLPNVEFDIPKLPYLTYKNFLHSIFATHGDTVLDVGYPGSNIAVKQLASQINRINASIKDRDEFAVFIVGHVHTASQVYLDNGSVVITNSAITPPGAHAISLNIFESKCGQWLLESTQETAVANARLLQVGIEDDENEELDLIIKPWRQP